MNYRRLFVPNSIIFVTIVTYERQPILIQNIVKVKRAIKEVYPFYKFKILAYSILNDHIHFLIKPQEITDYPKIIRAIKYNFTVGIAMPTYKKFWQNRYFEHTIRDEKDLYRHLDYIHYNSMKHYNISPKNWNFSSFKHFVKSGYYEENWCNSLNRYDINSLNYE